jgi:hypothetical protein
MHAWLSQRMLMLEVEQRTLWQKILGFLGGRIAGG